MFVLVSLGGWAWFERAPLLRDIADLWIVSDAVTHADAVVVLGGGLADRPFVAANLYKKGLANKVLVSQAADNVLDSQVVEGDAATIGTVQKHTELNRQALLKLGVPASAIETFGTANRNTRDEAVALSKWAGSHGAKVVIIPTEIFSSRRVRWIFRREFAGKVTRIEVSVIEPSRYTQADWWKHKEGIISFQLEILKYIYYRLMY